MYEKASFKDKLISILLSPFDIFLFKHYGNNSLKSLGITKDTSQKWLIYYYLLIHSKLYEVLGVTYDGYENQPQYVFVPVDTRLDDLFLELLKGWKILDKYPFIDALKLGQYNGFRSLNGDTEYRKGFWKASKCCFKEDIENMCKDLSLDPLSNELKGIFLEIDELISNHAKLKQEVLNANVITYKKVTLNIEADTITVANGKAINLTSNALRLLKLMLENVGKTVTYKQIAETLNTQSYTDCVDSAVKLDIQQIKKDISETLVASGVDKTTANEVRNYLEPIRDTGYTLRNNN
jgi:hypothetical protein